MSGSKMDPASAKINIPTLDSGWSIDIGIMLEQAPKQTKATLLLTKKDTNSCDEYQKSSQEDVFMPGFQQPRGGIFEPRPMLKDPMLVVKHSRAAFEGPIQFTEGVTREIRLPEEDPKDFLLLARFLIQAPPCLKEIQHHHWPYPCEPKDHCKWCYDDYLNTTQIPVHFRFCAMLERLGFELDDMHWSMLCHAAESSPTLVQPATLEWALQNSLEGGCFRRYVAKMLLTVLKARQTAFDTYEPVLKNHPDMLILMLKEGFSTGRPATYECVPEERGWKYHRRTVVKHSLPSSP